jgi:tetratricopeptide (TPR) repeat protein
MQKLWQWTTACSNSFEDKHKHIYISKQSSEYYMPRIAILFIIIFCIFHTPSAIADTKSLQKHIEDSMRHAKTYYWLAMAEDGNLKEFDQGLEYIERGQILLDELKENSFLPSNVSKIERSLKALRSDIEQQRNIAHDTLFGVFPLARFLNGRFLASPGPAPTFEFFDDADVVAVISAGTKLKETLLYYQRRLPRNDVFFSSNPPNKAYENELRAIFNADPRFYVHTENELIDFIEDDCSRIEFANNPERAVSLLKEFGFKQGLFVTTRVIDQVDNIKFHQVEGRIFDTETDEIKTYKVMGFARDLKNNLWPLIGLQTLIFLILTILLKYKLIKGYFLGIGISVFLIARFLPWLTLTVINKIIPPHTSLAIDSFYWIAILSFAIFAIPFIITTIIIIRIHLTQNYLDKLSVIIFYISTCMGMTAYISGPAIGYLGLKYGVIATFVFALGSIVVSIYCGYQFSNHINENDDDLSPFVTFTLSLLLGCVFLIAFITLDAVFIGLVFGGIIAIIGISSIAHAKNSSMKLGKNKNYKSSSINDDTGTRSSRLIGSSYITPDVYEDIKEYILASKSNEPVIAMINGPSGSGKSSLVRKIQAEIQFRCKYFELSAIDENLKEYIINIIINKNLQKTFKILQVVASILPYFNSSKEILSEDLSTKNENNQYIDSFICLVTKTLDKKIDAKKPVLIIDDFQLIDHESLSFLRSFVARIIELDLNISIILLASQKKCEYIYGNCNKINYKLFSLWLEKNEIFKILKEFNLTKRTSNLFHDYFKSCSALSIGVIASKFKTLETKGLIKKRCDNRRYFDNTDLDFLNIPDENLEDRLNKLSMEEINLLTSAAIIGDTFNAHMLARISNSDHMDIIDMLEQIEKRTNLVQDIVEQNDLYKFESKVIRDRILARETEDSERFDIHQKQALRIRHKRAFRYLQDKKNLTEDEKYACAEHAFYGGLLEESYECCTEVAKNSHYKSKHCYTERFAKFSMETIFIILNKNQSECSNKMLYDIIDLIDIIIKALVYLGEKNVAENDMVYYRKQLEFIQDPNLQLHLSRIQSFLYFSNGYYDKAIKQAQLATNSYTDVDFHRAECLHYLEYSKYKQSSQTEFKNNATFSLQEARDIFDTILKKDPQKYPNIKLEFPDGDLAIHMPSDTVLDDHEKKFIELLAQIENSSAIISKIDSEKLKKFKNSILLKEIIDNSQGIAMSYGGLGRLFKTQGKHLEAIEYFNKNLKICKKIHDFKGQVLIYSQIAEEYLALENYDESISNYEYSLEISEILDDNKGKLYSLSGLILAYASKVRNDKNDKNNIPDSYGVAFFEHVKKTSTEYENLVEDMIKKFEDEFKTETIKPAWLSEMLEYRSQKPSS